MARERERAHSVAITSRALAAEEEAWRRTGGKETGGVGVGEGASTMCVHRNAKQQCRNRYPHIVTAWDAAYLGAKRAARALQYLAGQNTLLGRCSCIHKSCTGAHFLDSSAGLESSTASSCQQQPDTHEPRQRPFLRAPHLLIINKVLVVQLRHSLLHNSGVHRTHTSSVRLWSSPSVSPQTKYRLNS